MDLSVNELMYAFVQEKSLAGRVVNGLPRVEQKGLGTMAIGVHNHRITLFIDPDFVKEISLQFGLFVVEHEIYGHYTNAHIPRFLEFLSTVYKPEDKEKAHVIWNIAADCAANDGLRNSRHFHTADAETREYVRKKMGDAAPPEAEDKGGMILPERYGLPPGKTLEFYVTELMKKVEQRPGRGRGRGDDGQPGDGESQKGKRFTDGTPGTSSGSGELDQLAKDMEERTSHDKWPGLDELQTMSPEELQSIAKQIHRQTKGQLKEAIKEVQKSRGTIPSHLEEWLEEYTAEPTVPWWDVFAAYIHATKRVKLERGIQRPSRPLQALAEEDPRIIPAIGTTKEPTWRVMFLLDTSGSMDGTSLEIGRNELQKILDMDDDMEVRWVQFDTQVTFDETYCKGDKLPTKVFGRGGTDFNGAFAHIAKYFGNSDTEPDAVIVFTDGYAPSVSPQYRIENIPVIWCLTRDGSDRYIREGGYGEIVQCAAAHNKDYAK